MEALFITLVLVSVIGAFFMVLAMVADFIEKRLK